MYLRTAGRVRRSRSRVGSGQGVARRKIYQDRVSFVTQIAPATFAAFNVLVGLEAYLGVNVVGTVLRIRGYLSFNPLTAGQLLNGVGYGFQVADAELPASTTITSTTLHTGNSRYMKWMDYWNVNEDAAATAPVPTSAWGYRTKMLDVRAKRKISTIDEDLQLWTWNDGANIATCQGWINIVVAMP